LNCDKQGSTNAHEVFDTQSYLTYEDQATQTEDEDDQDPDLHDLIFLLYGIQKQCFCHQIMIVIFILNFEQFEIFLHTLLAMQT